MSNLNGEDRETDNPPCAICGIKSYIEHEGLSLCNRHYTGILDTNPSINIEEVKLFRNFFGTEKKYSKLSIENVIEIRKTIALEKLTKQLDFCKDEDGALFIRNNASSNSRTY